MNYRHTFNWHLFAALSGSLAIHVVLLGPYFFTFTCDCNWVGVADEDGETGSSTSTSRPSESGGETGGGETGGGETGGADETGGHPPPTSAPPPVCGEQAIREIPSNGALCSSSIKISVLRWASERKLNSSVSFETERAIDIDLHPVDERTVRTENESSPTKSSSTGGGQSSVPSLPSTRTRSEPRVSGRREMKECLQYVGHHCCEWCYRGDCEWCYGDERGSVTSARCERCADILCRDHENIVDDLDQWYFSCRRWRWWREKHSRHLKPATSGKSKRPPLTESGPSTPNSNGQGKNLAEINEWNGVRYVRVLHSSAPRSEFSINVGTICGHVITDGQRRLIAELQAIVDTGARCAQTQ